MKINSVNSLHWTLKKKLPFNDNGGHNNDGSKNRDEPIYHIFLNESYKLADRAILITPARFLFDAGQTPKNWNEKMLNDKHLKVEFYEKESSKVFPNTDIKGGVAVTYRDKSKDFGVIGSFTSENLLNSIVKKVTNRIDFQSLSSIAYPKSSYKFTDILHKENIHVSDLLSEGEQYSISTTAFDKVQSIFFEEYPEDCNNYVQILGRENNKRVIKWIKDSYISGPDNYEKYKVALPASNGSGNFGETLSSPVVLPPYVGHTQTFMSFGSFNNNNEAEALLKYMNTKFLRAMLGVMKVTQHNPLKTWKYVPIQFFIREKDIDWTKSIPEIDNQLYAKYGLDEEEIAFIETRVKEME